MPSPKTKSPRSCRTHGICWLAIFGSALRDDFGSNSDIDLLFEFEPGNTSSLPAAVALEQQLSEMFGRHVNLVERGAIEASRNYFRWEAIVQSAETIYVA